MIAAARHLGVGTRASAMKRNGIDRRPGASLLPVRGKLILAEAIENPVLRHSALAGYLDAPVREIEGLAPFIRPPEECLSHAIGAGPQASPSRFGGLVIEAAKNLVHSRTGASFYTGVITVRVRMLVVLDDALVKAASSNLAIHTTIW